MYADGPDGEKELEEVLKKNKGKLQ